MKNQVRIGLLLGPALALLLLTPASADPAPNGSAPAPGATPVALAGEPAKNEKPRSTGETPAGDITYNAMTKYRMQLDWHPIGGVVPEGKFRFTNFIRMHPVGFRADTYNLYFGPTYGLGDGWEVTAGVTGAQRLGPGGQALFFGGGVQKLLMKESKNRPALSLGGYGMTGPHDHQSGAIYLAGTKKVWGQGDRALFLHGGAKFELYDSDDYGDGTGIRPYAGAMLALSRRALLSGEFSPAQPWEETNVYAIRATYLIWRRVGLSGGIRNNGYETHPFVTVTF